MLSKLSLRNARRQARDYLVYFVTIMLSAALIYAFNGLVFSDEIRNLSEMMESMPLVIVLASIVVVCIIGWLVSYTTRFMLNKRSREFGTYILLGIENRQVASMFFLENLVVGFLAILLGSLLGNLIHQVLRAITLTLFDVPYTFGFVFSLKAVLLTVVYFVFIYLFALVRSRRRIKNMKIHDLTYLDRQNEAETVKKERSRRRLFTVSIVLGLIGTALLMMRVLILGIIGAAMIIVFFYGFFLSFSSGVPSYFNKRPAKKYKGRNLLIFRFLTSKLSTMGVVMATIAVLFTATLIAEGTGIIFNALFQSRTKQTTSFDVYIASHERDISNFEEYFDYMEENIEISSEHSYNIYRGNDEQVQNYIRENVKYMPMFDYDTLLAFSDYQALRDVMGYPPVELAAGKYIVHCMPYLQDVMERYREPVSVGDQNLISGGLYTENFTQSLWDGNGHGFILVVPDEVLVNQPIIHRTYVANTVNPVSKAAYEGISAIRDEKDKNMEGYDTLFFKTEVRIQNASMYATIVYPLYYLALVLTMVATTILTIQLLSESDRYKQQYALLHNLGMDRREIRQSLNRQFAIFYALPALPSLLVSMPFILALGSTLDPGVLTGAGQLWGLVLGAVGLFALIYLIYIIAAYSGFKRNVLP